MNVFIAFVDWLSFYYSLFLLILGCLCNPMSFIVFSRRSFRSTTMSVYLRVLSLSDLGAILNGLTRFFVLRAYGIDLRSTRLSCALGLFCVNLFLYLSSWTLVIVTLERVLSIIWPHRVHSWCNLFKAKMVLFLVFIVLSGLSLPLTFLYGDRMSRDPLTNVTVLSHCEYLVNDPVIDLGIWILDVIVFAFLPSLLLIIFNIIIVSGVVRSRQKVMKRSPQTCGSDGLTTISGCVSVSSQREMTRERRRSRRETSLTMTLLTVNVTFIVCNFPTCAYSFSPYFISEEGIDYVGSAVNDLLIILMYTNNSLNFVLYCVTGSKFRSEVKAIFHDIKRAVYKL